MPAKSESVRRNPTTPRQKLLKQDQVMALQALGIKAAMLSSADSREAG